MAFTPKSVRLSGNFDVAGAIDEIFPLFSPLGERLWVPGWDPELLFPEGAEWEVGMVFRTREELGEAVWYITKLDRASLEVEYVRVEFGRYLARVSVKCRAVAGGTVDVGVTYTFVGLTERGNSDIEQMGQPAYEEKMFRWKSWIGARPAKDG